MTLREINARNSENLKIENNLSDVSDVEQTRLNLDVPRTKALASLGMSGIYSTGTLSPIGTYDTTIANDFIEGTSSTILTTYLGNGDSFYLMYPYYNYNTFAPYIRNNGSEINIGSIEGYDEETGDFYYNDYVYPLSFKSGHIITAPKLVIICYVHCTKHFKFSLI